MHVKLHKNTIFQPEPWAITCMALCGVDQQQTVQSAPHQASQKRLAVVRRPVATQHLAQKLSNITPPTRIEIWNLTRAQAVIEQVLDDSFEQPTQVEQVAWAGTRLLACGMSSYLYEYDLKMNTIKTSINVPSGGCWCLAVNSTASKVAVGTEEGFISIFSLGQEEFIQETSMRNTDRILSLAWHGDNIISGSQEFIKIWNTEDGRSIEHIRVGDSRLCIWSLLIIPAKRTTLSGHSDDFTIVSADSAGRTSFWCGKTGTELASFTEHQGDVIALAVSKDGSRLYSSGVDPKIVLFSKNSSTGKWAPSLNLQHHMHDVRALCCLDDGAPDKSWILSGGVDSHLFKVKGPPKVIVRYQQSYRSKVAITGSPSSKRMILMTSSYHVEVWMGSKLKPDDSLEVGATVPMTQRPHKLVRLNFEDRILSADLSDDWLLVALPEGILLYNIIIGEDGELKDLVQKPTDYCASPSKSLITQVSICNSRLAALITGSTLTFLKLHSKHGAFEALSFNFPSFISHIYTNGSQLIAVQNRQQDWNLRIFSLGSKSNDEPAESVDPLKISCPLVGVTFDPLLPTSAWLLASDLRLLHLNMSSGELLEAIHLTLPGEEYQLENLCILNTSLVPGQGGDFGMPSDDESGDEPSPRKKARQAALKRLNPSKEALKKLPPIESRLIFSGSDNLYKMTSPESGSSGGTVLLEPLSSVEMDSIVSIHSPPQVTTKPDRDQVSGSTRKAKSKSKNKDNAATTTAVAAPELIVTQFSSKALFSILPPPLAKKAFDS